MITIQKRVLVLIIILTILCSSLVLAGTKVKDSLPEQHLKKLHKSLQLIDETEEKEVIIKVKNKNTILKDKDIKDTNNKNLVKAKLKGNKLISLTKDNNIELIEEDIDVNLTGQLTYGVQYTNVPSAWQTTTAKGIKVAVLDTGISPHDDLVIAGGYPDNYDDNVNHGTPVAGVVTSVAPDVDLYAVKIMNATTGKISDAIAGLQWAIDNKMDIVVMSFGTLTNSQIFKELLEEAYNNDIVLVAAGGNNGQILYPAKYSSVIAVGSINEMNHSITPQGFELEVMAAGDRIYTTTNNNGYDYFSGTSLAAPHIAGIAALLKANDPSLANKEIRGKLQNDAVDLGEQGKDDLYGFGLAQINLETNDYELFEYKYNYTVYKYVNDTIILYTEGFGNLDDVHFEEGRYHAIKRYKNKEYYEEFEVNDEGIINVLIYGLEFDDDYTFDGSSSDRTVWVNGNLDYRSDNFTNVDVACYNNNGVAWNWNDVSNIKCYADSSSKFQTCKDWDTGGLKTFCDNNPLRCKTTGVNSWNPQSSSYLNEARQFGVLGHLYLTCGTNPSISEPSRAYFVVQPKKTECGGATYDIKAFYYNENDPLWATLTPSTNCNTATSTCDSAIDENYNATSETYDFSTGSNSPCRLKDGQSCTSGSQCLTNHYCVNSLCTSNDPTTYCNGSFEINTEDSAGSPMSSMYVYFNGINNGTTNSNGQKFINLTNAYCNINQNISVRCFNNQTRECGTASSSISFNGDVDSYIFDCNMCKGDTNLWIELGDVNAQNIQYNTYNFSVNVHTQNVNANNVVVSFFGLNKNTGLIEKSANATISLTSSDTIKTAAITMNTTWIDYLMIQVDPDKKVQEPKTDNFVMLPHIKERAHAILNINTDNKKADEAIEEYLKLFVDTNTINPSVTINVGKPSSPKKGKGWSYDTNEIRFNNIYASKRPHVGLVAKDAELIGTHNLYVFGNQIEGTVAAVKRLVNARAIFLERGGARAELLDSYDTLAVSVLDLMNNAENKPFKNTNTDNFKNIVSDILNDNNFEIAIKTVKTTNDNTTLRMKFANSDYSDDFKDAVSLNKTVVLSHGMHSDLNTWNDFAQQLAQSGFDTWTIEMYGGPTTDADCSPSGQYNCPNYTFSDLKTYYWPALMAGVQEYSGKTNLSYVGYDLGCTVALESLEMYENGKNNAGNCFNLVTGQYDIQCDLSNKPVDTFVGVGCIGNFSKLGLVNNGKYFYPYYTKLIFENKNLLKENSRISNFYNGHIPGDYPSDIPFLIESINYGLMEVSHEGAEEFVGYIAGEAASLFLSGAIYLAEKTNNIIPKEDKKLSVKVYEFLTDRNFDVGEEVNLTNLMIIKGDMASHRCFGLNHSSNFFGCMSLENTDNFITNGDTQDICKNLNSNNKYYVNFENVPHFGAGFDFFSEGLKGLDDRQEVKDAIFEYLNNGKLSDRFNKNIISLNDNCE